MTKLSLAMAYTQQAFKRQADNRHQLLIQGLAMMLEYHECRQKSENWSERQESCYNLGRMYHLLGLTHLAIVWYERCLELRFALSGQGELHPSEDFVSEAALALQGIWATSGNMGKASEVTEKHLVL